MFKLWELVKHSRNGSTRHASGQSLRPSLPSLEVLERRELLDAALHHAFGNNPVMQPGDLQITNASKYDPQAGYGWQNGAVKTQDEYALTTSGQYAVDLANGKYQVT